MNKFIGMVLVVAAAGVSFAGEMEKSAVSADLLNIDLTTTKQVIVPVPAMETVKAAVSASFMQAVKTEYERLTGYTDFNSGTYTLNTLPIAKVSELPAAAKKQYKKDVAEWGEYYLVTPYKMPVRGQTAYVIQVETEGGSFVTIFDAKGSKVAEGGCSESGDFGWSGDKSVANRAVEKVTRKCWNYDKQVFDLTFIGKNKLTIKKGANSCTVLRDASYPSSHVPADYQSWFRYYENAKIDGSTNYGANNPCTIALGIPSAGHNDNSGVFYELRLDSALLDPAFRDSAKMVITTDGDGAGPLKEKLVCR